jgi:hypothetical protein
MRVGWHPIRVGSDETVVPSEFAEVLSGLLFLVAGPTTARQSSVGWESFGYGTQFGECSCTPSLDLEYAASRSGCLWRW